LVLGIVVFGTKDKWIGYLVAEAKPNTEELKALIKELITSNPEIIVEALKIAHNRENEKIQAQLAEKIKQNKEKIENSNLTPSYGAEDSKITMVYFFDYNCGYCKRGSAIINDILAKNKDVKIVYKELPILGKQSQELARAALAVYSIDKNKYRDFHDALMGVNKAEDNTVEEILTTLSISTADFEEALKNPKIEEELDSINNLASQIGIGGTPALIINDEMIPGVDEYVISRRLKYIREN
jgi:protein-disulfide isomerase